jgi:Tol biopolymer transport system component
MREVNFVPKTHILSFQAIWCKEKKSSSPCSKIIFLADTDTGEVRKLVDLGLTLQNLDPTIYDIKFSPNGKMMAVGVAGSVKIYALDGKVIRQGILPFTPADSEQIFPSLFWLPDSSGLIAALPDKTIPDSYSIDGLAPAYTIWRYILDGGTTGQISFSTPVAGTLEVSPDGNWIVYGGLSPAAPELYFGNLANGSAFFFGNSDLTKSFQWSPDSKHFIHDWTVVVSLDKQPLDGGAGPSWIDSNHFIYFDVPQRNPLIQEERFLVAEIKEDGVFYYELGYPYFSLKVSEQKQ